MIESGSTEAISFTFSISESVLNSSDSSSASSTEAGKSERNSSCVITPSPCQPRVVNPPAVKRTAMPRVVSVGKAKSRSKNPYIDDDDGLGQEMAMLVDRWEA